MAISLGNAGAIVLVGLWWGVAALRGRRLLQTGRTSSEEIPKWAGPLQAVGMLMVIVIVVLSDDNMGEAVLVAMSPFALLTMFEAGTVWGRDNPPQVTGTTTASSPSGFSD